MNRLKKTSIFLNGLSWPIFHGLASAFLLIMLAVQASSLGSYIDTRIIAPIFFNVREYLGQTPPIHPKLKVIALDDSTFSYLGGPRLNYAQLAMLLDAVGKRHPQAILIDSLLSDQPTGIAGNLPDSLASLPVYTGSFPSQFPLRFREPTDLSQKAYRASTYLEEGLTLPNLPYNLDLRQSWIPYGNSSGYGELVRATGHITYNRDGTISPFYQINDETLLPHLSLYSASSIKLGQKALTINGREVPLTKRGGLLINHRPPGDFYQRSVSLRPILQRAQAGEVETQINEGDIVLVLLAFATGNTDFHEGGPFGEIPGGLIIASMISDVLDGRWISRWETDIALILTFGIAGIVLGINARVRYYWVYLVSAWTLTSTLALVLFSYAQIWMPWLIPLIAFTGTSLIHFAHVRIQDEMKMMLIEKNYYAEKALRLEEMHKKAELESNLALGRAVQKLLLPRALQGTFYGFQYNMQYKPVAGMSGDWLYVWDFSLGERRIFMGDVMGTGPSAAIPVAALIGILKDCEEQKLGVEESFARLNRRLIELFDQHVVCSLSAIVLYRDGRIELFNAGGPGCFVFGGKQAEYFVMRSSPIGLNPTIELARCDVDLQDHQTLFTFTDGFMHETKDLKRLVRHLRQEKIDRPPLDQIEGWLHSTLQSPSRPDDQSLICIQRSNKAKNPRVA
ncbi:MAG TPA: SpoIIE family protein phosphatase [Oligoflexus sp.]|uniref:SpoIIE family protein phosphatase n=1 Tax=Oligoflexus sp. TaxID=1971216 RepID=UPI002D7F106F|nr:SpoIIE family protein phosphatase [Oligoflexus sp.]HET9240198.1 SpoIIE family protein phosphatase [Oligoflexus sp.]